MAGVWGQPELGYPETVFLPRRVNRNRTPRTPQSYNKLNSYQGGRIMGVSPIDPPDISEAVSQLAKHRRIAGKGLRHR